MVGRTLIVLAVVGCHHDAPPPAPPAVSNTARIEPAEQCEDEPIGALHTTDPSYLVSADEIAARTMRDHSLEFQACFVHYRTEYSGKINVTIRIDAVGKPALVQTHGPDPEVDHCICTKVLAIVFGITSSTVTYPMYFVAR